MTVGVAILIFGTLGLIAAIVALSFVTPVVVALCLPVVVVPMIFGAACGPFLMADDIHEKELAQRRFHALPVHPNAFVPLR